MMVRPPLISIHQTDPDVLLNWSQHNQLHSFLLHMIPLHRNILHLDILVGPNQYDQRAVDLWHLLKRLKIVRGCLIIFERRKNWRI